MQIIWHGQSCFQIISQKGKNNLINIVIDPFDKTVGLRVPKLIADILLISHNYSKVVFGSPFIIDSPGEYEIKEVFVQGIPAFYNDFQGKDQGEITIYIIETEGMRLCHLGGFGQKELTVEQVEKIGEIDILMLPIGGTYMISAKEAVAIMSQIEPKIIIPMHYYLPKLKVHPVKSREAGAKQFNGVKLDSLDEFLKTIGLKTIEPQNKLSIKKKDISKEKAKIIVLNP